MYLPGPGNQIHDLNPTVFPPVGLFWTLEIASDDSHEEEGNDQQTGEWHNGAGVEVDLEEGSALMKASNVPIFDYGDINNALFGGGPTPVPGRVSFKVAWGQLRVGSPFDIFEFVRRNRPRKKRLLLRIVLKRRMGALRMSF